jgi:rubrerythrin
MLDYASEVMALEQLAKHELAMGSLYQFYAQKYPEYSEFWNELAQEEISHNIWIRELASQKFEGKLNLNEEILKQWKGIKYSTDYIEEQINSLVADSYPMFEALSIALYIERELIEKGYFESFSGGRNHISQLLLKLSRETNEHIKRLSELWTQLKPKGDKSKSRYNLKGIAEKLPEI